MKWTLLFLTFFLGKLEGADVGCLGSTSGEHAAVGCTQSGCCEWNLHVTNSDLCDGNNEVCCYSSITCDHSERDHEACRQMTNGAGDYGQLCTQQDCCAFNFYVLDPTVCTENGAVCCFSSDSCNSGGGGEEPIGEQACLNSVSAGGDQGVGCTIPECCEWNLYVTDSNLCPSSSNGACCYSSITCNQEERDDTACRQMTNSLGERGELCTERDCCEHNFYLEDSSVCTQPDSVCCFSSDSCNNGGIFPCVNQLCESNPQNIIRGCDPMGCGHYGASRGGGTRTHLGSDVECTMGDDVYAAFNGRISRYVIPYGTGSCCDNGFALDGSGDWNGYTAWYFYVRLTVPIGTQVTAGQKVAEHLGLHCGCYGTSMTDHTHFQLFRWGSVINPTSNLNC